MTRGTNIVIGSRYAEGGSLGGWRGWRRTLSKIGTAATRLLCRADITDPMSGFFALDRGTFEVVLPRLHPKGFKILLEILVRAPQGIVIREVPYTFGKRLHGESKLSARVQCEALQTVFSAALRRFFGR